MKKFETSEDLDQLSVSVPLNKARSLLTMAYSAAEKALDALLKAENGEAKLGAKQKAALEAYVEDYKLLRDLISDAIMDNLTPEQQQAISDHEKARTASLKEELVDTVSERLQEVCSDSDCEACRALKQVMGGRSVDPKTEFDLEDLPEGTIMFPGSDEEN